MLVIGGPLETADFLSVALQPPLSSGRRTDVSLQDHPVPAARGQLLTVPC